MKRLQLSDGNEIPCMGFGCYKALGQEATDAVACALGAGYRYIDSAANYNNEAEVGEGLKKSPVPREEFFLLSKIWPSFYGDPKKSLQKTLTDLGTNYLDCCLLHWPGLDTSKRLRTYEFLLEMRDKGIVRSVGVSNFSEENLEEIRQEFGAYPVINEIECHPTFQQRELIRFCAARGIQIVSYSPINRGVDLDHEILRTLANKYKKSAAQIILNWHIQHDQIPIPKSVHRERILENIDLFDFSLTPEEISAVDALECGARRGKDPRVFPAVGE